MVRARGEERGWDEGPNKRGVAKWREPVLGSVRAVGPGARCHDDLSVVSFCFVNHTVCSSPGHGVFLAIFMNANPFHDPSFLLCSFLFNPSTTTSIFAKQPPSLEQPCLWHFAPPYRSNYQDQNSAHSFLSMGLRLFESQFCFERDSRLRIVWCYGRSAKI